MSFSGAGDGGIAPRASGTLIDRAVAVLASGPTRTETLAEAVLALRGNPSAAASAVFALLGSDDRFRVNGEGVWTLAEPEQSVDGLLADQEWVVVDVETTGGSPAHGHRIIEVGAVVISQGRIVERHCSLVNPLRPIPRVVASLTGITDEEVRQAPLFGSIVPELTRVITGRVFVGHNVNFDWRFLCAEMERCTGRTLTGRRLCTLRLARRLTPHLTSRALGALAHHFGIEMETHHRALADAEATANLLLTFLADLQDRSVSDWGSLERFLRTRPRRRRKSAMPRSMDAA